MTNPSYQRILDAPERERRDLFVATARRVGTTEQNVEKDFWVSWTLDVLFHRLPSGGPRLLFKGGTSLSKAFGLINRFSEDIDVTVFRDDLGESVTLEELERLSGKQRQKRLDAIKTACQSYINGQLRTQLTDVVVHALANEKPEVAIARVVADDTDPDGQTLLLRYPSVLSDDPYVQPAVRIESGAKSALDPHVAATIEPYVEAEVVDPGLTVSGITTIEAARTFWDKVIILHGLRRWFENRSALRQEGQRVTRHYYDVHSIMKTEVGSRAISNLAMADECARHARMFFDRPDFNLHLAVPGTFALVASDPMLERLRRDYDNMAGMILGVIPAFDDVMASVADLEARLNGSSTPA